MDKRYILTEEPLEGVTLITLNCPEKRNALSCQLMEELCLVLDRLASDPKQRVMIFRGAGPVFCAGLDLKEARDKEKMQRSAALIQRVLSTVAASSLVSIAVVHGAAIAGGAGLMSACDFALGAEDARIGYPEVRRGLVAGLVMTFLRRQAPERAVRELLLLGELVDAKRAQQMGLLNNTLSLDKLLGEALRIAELVKKGAPKALADSKSLLNEMGMKPMEEDMQRAMEFHCEARGSQEAREGITAFLEKREPVWAL